MLQWSVKMQNQSEFDSYECLTTARKSETFHLWLICALVVLTSGLQSCTVILRLSTTLPVCTVSEIMVHALRSAKEIGYTGQVSRAGVHLGGDRGQDLCLIPLKSFVSFLHSDLWKLNHWEQLPRFPGHTGEHWAQTRCILFSTKYVQHLELVCIISNLELTGYNRSHQWHKAAFVLFFQSKRRNLGRTAGRKVRLPCTVDDHTQPKFEHYTSQHHHLSRKYNIIPTKHHCWTSEFHHFHQCQLYCCQLHVNYNNLHNYEQYGSNHRVRLVLHHVSVSLEHRLSSVMPVLNLGGFSWQPGQHAAQSGQKCVQPQLQSSGSAVVPAGEPFGRPEH